MQPQLVTFALARQWAGQRGATRWRRGLVAAGAYVGTEWAWPKLFADTIGHGLYASAWMRQAADVAGAPGLTLVLLLANECALGALRAGAWRRALAPLAGCAGLALALLAYGAVRCAQLAGDGTRVSAGVVQADIAHYDRLAAEVGTFEAVRRILDDHFALSDEVLERGDPDLLVWPETVYPTTFGSPKSPDGAAFDREIAAFVARSGRPLVFGAYDAEDGDEFNAAIFLAPAAHGPLAFEAYRKASLFPLTERVPALLESGLVRRWLPWLGAWKPGKGAAVVPLTLRDGRTIRVAPLICYDAVDPGLAVAAVRSGAELILTLSNDSWFAAGGGPRLHLVVSAFRSLETRRPQVRATNTGISAIIDATGEILASAAVGERTTLVASVRPERAATTLVLAWGNWLGPVALAGAAILLGVPRRPA
jgi:apolipoprotein N-acyltransferase